MAANMNGETNHDDAPDGPSHQEGSRISPIKKIMISMITFIPALITVSLINFVLTQLVIFLNPVPDAPPSPKIIKSPPKKIQKIVTTTVHIPPSESDLDRLRQENEASDPLPPIALDENIVGKSNRLKSLASSLKSAIDGRRKKLDDMKKEFSSLEADHGSFLDRFDGDVSQVVLANEKFESAEVLNEKLSSVREVLSLTEFSDMDRANLVYKFGLAGNDLNWLVRSSDEQFFFNDEGILLEILIDGISKKSDECPMSFLNMTGKNVCSELTIPSDTKRIVSSGSVETPVPAGTAREWDLYQSVESIKEILSRREVALMKTETDGSMPSPLGQSGMSGIQEEITHAASTVKKGRAEHVSQQKRDRLEWMSKVKLSVQNENTEIDDDNMCASSNLVEKMVAVGLESLRRESDMSSAVRTTLFSSLVDEPNFEANKLRELTKVMEGVSQTKIDYEKKNNNLPPSGSKSHRKSIFYLVDGPLLHRGVTGWMNSLVDFISGYNDNVDALLDWIVGESQSTIGEIFTDAFLKAVRLIPFHEQIAMHFKSAGILAGRTRTLLEE